MLRSLVGSEMCIRDSDNSVNASLDEINFDGEDTSTDINLDSLGFDESKENSTSDLLSNNMAQINDFSNDKSKDMSNISNWLDSLDTPNKGSEDISEWLDQLEVNNPVGKDSTINKVRKSNDDVEDISFQFLEDLLERDPNSNQEKK